MSLEKIAQKQPLTKEDIISAATELVELEKQAAEADAYGRQLAHEYVEELVKQAEEEAEIEEIEEKKKEEEEEEEKKEEEKTSSDKELLSAIETLRQLGIVK